MIKTKQIGRVARSLVRRRSWSVLASPILIAIVVGCSGTDSTGIPALVQTNPYARLQLNVEAAAMSTVAPYDTLQLIPTAYDADGNVIPLPGPVTYTSNDTTIKVNASGLVHLTNPSGTASYVVAKVQDTVRRLTHADTAFIRGFSTTPASPLASFSIHPAGKDSAVLDLGGGTKPLTVTALDATGKAIPMASLKVHFRSEDPTIVTIDASAGTVQQGIRPGTVRLTASTTYYGVTKTDSLDFRIGYWDTLTVTTSATALPDGSYRYAWTIPNLMTGVNKTVIFAIPDMASPAPGGLLYAGVDLPVGDRQINEGVHVVFDDSTAAQMSPASATLLAAQSAANGSGNVNIQVPDSMVVVDSINPKQGGLNQYSVKLTNYCKTAPYPCAAARSFATPGTYHFTSPTTGASGTITVVGP